MQWRPLHSVVPQELFFFIQIIKENLIQVPTESDELVKNMKAVRPLYNKPYCQ
jgi:hypothetical protein